MSSSIQPGETIPLNVTQKSRHRIFVGLGWDPNESPTLIDKLGALIGKREKYHDLDLTCYYYNKDNACLGYIGVEKTHSTNQTGSIYHSGDSIEGVGEGDDEQISVELINLPPNIEHLVFKASIKSGHHFGDIAAPEIRLCDGYTGRCFVTASMHEDAAMGHDAYIFARISRARDNNAWNIHCIHAFENNRNSEEWQSALVQYL